MTHDIPHRCTRWSHTNHRPLAHGVVVALLLFITMLLIMPSSITCQSADLDDEAQYYFWNELTGDVQWEDPGDVAFWEGEQRVWYDEEGKKVTDDPRAMEYMWVESYSEEHGRYFYFNQETQSSTWERPADLAWRRVRVEEVSDEM